MAFRLPSLKDRKAILLDEYALLPLMSKEGVKEFALIDKECAHLDQHKWFKDTRGYARGDAGKLFLARAIMEPPVGMVVDHINGNPLDNRKVNLRVCTQKENLRNRRPGRSMTGYKGVRPDYRRKHPTFNAYITYDGKKRYLGKFSSAEAAAKAYNQEALKIFGEFAKLNEVTNGA